mmetsp:Transcript_16833/g.38011  ORF Transcript_16833/g.38011 Transcript_16833/m.38011 type:complete len:218 (+) Transcript_16833:178-831(+)
MAAYSPPNGRLRQSPGPLDTCSSRATRAGVRHSFCPSLITVRLSCLRSVIRFPSSKSYEPSSLAVEGLPASTIRPKRQTLSTNFCGRASRRATAGLKALPPARSCSSRQVVQARHNAASRRAVASTGPNLDQKLISAGGAGGVRVAVEAMAGLGVPSLSGPERETPLTSTSPVETRESPSFSASLSDTAFRNAGEDFSSDSSRAAETPSGGSMCEIT